MTKRYEYDCNLCRSPITNAPSMRALTWTGSKEGVFALKQEDAINAGVHLCASCNHALEVFYSVPDNCISL